MAAISEQEQWEEGVYQLETSDPVGGGEDGIDNKPHKHLANRTKWLKKQVEDLAIIDNNLNTRMNETEDILSNNISPVANLGIQNPQSVTLTNTKKTVGFMVHKYKGQSITDGNGDDLIFNPSVDILPWKGTFWNDVGADVDITYYTDDTQTITATVSVKDQTSFHNVGTMLDFTKANNGTGYYHDMESDPKPYDPNLSTYGLVKDDAGNIVESGEIALNTNTGFIADILVKNIDSNIDYVKHSNMKFIRQDGLRKPSTYYNNDNLLEMNALEQIIQFDNNGFNLLPLIDTSSIPIININLSDVNYISYITIFTHIKWGLSNHGKRYLKAYNSQTGEEVILYTGSGSKGHKFPSIGQVDFAMIKLLNPMSSPFIYQKDYNGYLFFLHGSASQEEYIHGILSSDDTNIYISNGISNLSSNRYLSYVSRNSENVKMGTYNGNGALNEVYDNEGNLLFILDTAEATVNANNNVYLYNAVVENAKIVRVYIKSRTDEQDWVIYDYLRGELSSVSFNLSDGEVTQNSSIFSLFNGSSTDMHFRTPVDNNEVDSQTQIQLTNSYLHSTNGKDEHGYITSKEEVSGLIPLATFEGLKDDTYYVYKEKGSLSYKTIKDISIGIYDKRSADDNRLVFDNSDGKIYTTTGGELISNGTFDTGVDDWTVYSDSGTAILNNIDSQLEVHNNSSATFGRAVQSISTEIGVRYKLSTFMASYSLITASSVKVKIGVSNNPDGSATYSDYVTSIDGIIELEFIAKNTTTYITIGLESEYTTQSAKFSDISCYKKQATLDQKILTPISFIAKTKVASGTPQYIEELDIPTNIMDTLSVKSIMIDNSDIKESLFGIDQKWQNMTPYRDWGEQYTNTSGKTIVVAVNIQSSGDGAFVDFEAYIDAIRSFNLEHGGVSGTIDKNTCLMIVPNGSTYQIDKSNDEMIIEWSELR